MKKSLTEGRLVSLEEYIKLIYDPYGEELVIISADDNEIVLSLPGEWKVILNSGEGTFKVIGDINKYYDIDRIKDIRDRFGELFSVYRMNNINKT